MASYGIWDGSSCKSCIEESCYIDNGVDEETPCRKCGWYRGYFDGSRYPPLYCSSSWGLATERIHDLCKEFPKVSREVISKYVQLSGENDMDAQRARDYLLAYTKCEEQQHPSGAEKDDVFFVLSLLQDQKNVKQEYRGIFVDDWTMDDMYVISAKIATKMKQVRNGFGSAHEEVSFDTEFISDVSGYSFNEDFDKDISGCLVDIIQECIGCFHCYGNNPTKICSKCKIARFCSKECQKLSWRNTDEPHKEKCGKFPSINAPGCEIIIGLYTHCLLERTRAMEIATARRTKSFFDEVVRCSSASWRESTARRLINLEITLMDAHDGNAFLTANSMFLDDKLQAAFDGVEADENSGICIGRMIMFKVLE